MNRAAEVTPPRGLRHAAAITFIIAAAIASGCASYENAGDKAFQSRNWDEAVRQYKLAYAKDPSPVLLEKLNVAKEEAAKDHYAKGQKFLDSENYDAAITEFSAVLEYKPDHPTAKDALASAKQGKQKKVYLGLLADGREETRNKRLGTAKQRLEKAVETYELNSEAKEELRKLEALFSQVEGILKLGSASASSEQWEEASRHYSSALEIWADNADALAGKKNADDWIKHHRHMNAGKQLLSIGKDEDAFVEFRTARDLRKTDPVIRLMDEIGGRLYPNALDRAVKLREEADAVKLGFATKAGKYEEALAAFQKAGEFKSTDEVSRNVDRIRNWLSKEAEARGMRALSSMDYEMAVESLEVANRHGSTTAVKLREAYYRRDLWAGLQAEADGQPKSAESYYLSAQKRWSTPEVESALKRVRNSGSSMTSPKELVTASSERRELLREDLRQRAILRALKSTRNADDLPGFDSQDSELGRGIDSVNFQKKGKIVSGQESKADVPRESVYIRERSVLMTHLQKGELDLEASYSVGLFSVGGEVGIRDESRTSLSEYSFELFYQVVTRKEVLDKPAIGRVADIDLRKWLDDYGTHFVAEIWYGAWIKLMVSKKVKTAEERDQFAAKVRAGFGPFSGSVSALKSLEKLKKEEDLLIRVESAGSTATVSDYDGFVSNRERFKAGARGQTVVRVRLQSYGSLDETSGFTLDGKQFATVVRRLQAAQIADNLLKVAEVQGKQQLEWERAEAERRRLEAEREQKRLLEEIAQKFSCKKGVSAGEWAWVQIDLSAAKYPATYTLKSISVTTGDNDKVQVFIFGPKAVQSLRNGGVALKDGEANLNYDWINQNMETYFDTTRDNEGTKRNVSRQIPKGEYYVAIRSFNQMMRATVTVTVEIEK